MFEKISGWYSDIKEIYDQIVNDIMIMAKRPLHWNRSIDIFTMLHTQRLENRYFAINVSADVPGDKYIVTLNCNAQELFHIDHKYVTVIKCVDAEECLQQINKLSKFQIFLIISGSIIPSKILSIFDYPQIHAIYFFSNNALKYPINKIKVSGFFDKQEDLSEQLNNDILFYEEHFNHTSRLDIFSALEHTGNIISQLNDQQTAFLIYNLFIDILPQIPLLEFKPKDLINICNTLFSTNGEKIALCVNQLFQEGGDVQNVVQDPRFSQIILRLHHLDKLNEFLVLQKLFAGIQKRVSESIKICKTITVYVSKLISHKTLKTMEYITGELVSIGILILATKSLLTARTIARKVTDNGLISVLFHIEVTEVTRLLQIDSDRVIFPLGSVFRVESVNKAPDGVWYVKIKPADSKFRFIQEQIQVETEEPLTWLSYGKYLYFLKQCQQAKIYFKFLLKRLPEEHKDRSSIEKNLAWICTMENRENEIAQGKRPFSDILKYAQSAMLHSAVKEHREQTYSTASTTTTTVPKTSVDHSTAPANIADE
jgi:hypothetical protein